nr:putative reverse transcriptase domain-containing protein [Tanacetum cinerariifolium]
MTKLTQKNVMFDWGDRQEAAFQLLKPKLCSAPILALPEGAEDFVAFCDALHKGLAIAPIAEVIPPGYVDLIDSPSSTTVEQDAPSMSNSPTPTETQSSVIPQDVREDNLDMEVAHIGNDPLFGIPILEQMDEGSPLNNVIGQLSRPVSTWLQLHKQALFCYYDAFSTFVEPKTYKEAWFVDPDNPNHVYKHKKALYGLKQAPRSLRFH